MTQDKAESLRETLRRETRAEHDRLDAMMAALPLGDNADYAGFLMIQYRARKPVEAWLAANGESGSAPPPQCPLIAADLADLQAGIPADSAGFSAPKGSNLGVAWVLAGSSLGNRSLLRQREKAGLDGPTRFLSCSRMSEFFKQMLTKINRGYAPAERELLVAGARSVFGRFEHEASLAVAEKLG